MKINITNSHANQYLVNDYNKAITRVFEVSKLSSQRLEKCAEMKANYESIENFLQEIIQKQNDLGKQIKEKEAKIIEISGLLKQLDKKSAEYEEAKQDLTEQTLLFGELKTKYNIAVDQRSRYANYKQKAYEQWQTMLLGNQEIKDSLDQALANLKDKASRLEAKVGKDLFFEFIKTYAYNNATSTQEKEIPVDLTLEIAYAEDENLN